MVDVTIESDRVVFRVEGLDKLWAFRSHLEIPLADIANIEHDPDAVDRWWHGFRLLGTEMPGLFAAGTLIPPRLWPWCLPKRDPAASDLRLLTRPTRWRGAWPASVAAALSARRNRGLRFEHSRRRGDQGAVSATVARVFFSPRVVRTARITGWVIAAGRTSARDARPLGRALSEYAGPVSNPDRCLGRQGWSGGPPCSRRRLRSALRS
jgi:hypothetical protein